ncbi:MAG: hypothetical protein GWN12_09920, partial [Thermoplasmata archaeon]|nr:hypothetical protein [Thermoplasmata archaeon]NIS12168.1 hypothetical protein [Thermoplasmata archaeon]NIS20272.1 hypothetical protein [Thermoplasmata archaeon]NIT77616.1 hypothetical protein [Thermoplasmata archaeon]NIU49363.1 hypothetical protein [Thermoplasmata archaeon]
MTTLIAVGLISFGILTEMSFCLAASILMVPALFCFLGYVIISWNELVFHDYAYMSHRNYPSEVRAVETAVGLLLMSKEAKFEKEVRTWRLRTRMQVVYSVRMMDGGPLDIEVRPLGRPETSGTQIRVFHDIEEEEKRRAVEGAIDDAVANPFKLQLRKYHLEEEPELHV